MGFLNYFKRHIINFPGWRTPRKIVIFESDDWESIRMPFRTIYEKALLEGYRIDLNEYEKYDFLLSENELYRDFKYSKLF